MSSPPPPRERLIKTLSRMSYLPAAVAGAFTGHFLNSTFADAGMGSSGVALAAAAAVALTGTYAAGVKGMFNGLAPLAQEDRRRATPALCGLVGFIALGSAVPNAIVSGGNIVAGVEDRAYIGRLAQTGDDLKRAGRSVEQLEGIIDAGAKKIENLATLEVEGGLGGASNSGALAALMRNQAAILKGQVSGLGVPRERVGDEIVKIDHAIDKMRAALIERDSSLDKRRGLMQRHGDDARSAALAVSAISPVASLQALADSLMGPQVEPVWSTKPDIRARQEDGFRKYKDELRRIGKSLTRPIADLAQGLKVSVPIYDPQPTSVLVFKHAYAIPHIWAFALALDGLPIALYLIACALSDAQRRKISIELSAEPAQSTATPNPLGLHPYPAATRARAAIAQSPKNGLADDSATAS